MAAGAMAVEELLRLVASPAKMLEIAPAEALSPSLRSGPARPPLGDGAAVRSRLHREGLGLEPGVASREVCAGLVAAVAALHARDLPATFVYAFDRPWLIGAQACASVTALLDREYTLVEDVWAWHVPPGSAGWPAHRGVSHALLDRDAPEVLNVWVALSDVAVDQACMHAVPLAEDPGYPAALESLDVPAASTRALPVGAGDALFWNANVLHWGGQCARDAAGPRVSCSFTLCRTDALDRFPELRPLPALTELDLAARMDVLARMVLLYGGVERGDVRGVVREWASITHALAARFGGPASERKAP